MSYFNLISATIPTDSNFDQLMRGIFKITAPNITNTSSAGKKTAPNASDIFNSGVEEQKE